MNYVDPTGHNAEEGPTYERPAPAPSEIDEVEEVLDEEDCQIHYQCSKEANDYANEMVWNEVTGVFFVSEVAVAGTWGTIEGVLKHEAQLRAAQATFGQAARQRAVATVWRTAPSRIGGSALSRAWPLTAATVTALGVGHRVYYAQAYDECVQRIRASKPAGAPEPVTPEPNAKGTVQRGETPH